LLLGYGDGGRFVAGAGQQEAAAYEGGRT